MTAKAGQASQPDKPGRDQPVTAKARQASQPDRPGRDQSATAKPGHDQPVTAKAGQASQPVPRQQMFTIGSEMGGMQEGGVQEAKRKLEAVMKRERRDREREEQLERARQPLMVTPNSKRARGREDDWEDLPSSSPSPRTPVRAGRRLQTPLNLYLVPQTPEERRKQLQKPGNRNPDMSALSSPVLRMKGKARSLAKPGSPGASRKAKQKPMCVSKYVNFFNNAQGLKQEEAKMFAPRRPSPTEATVSSVSNPEMAVPVLGGAQPMAHGHGSHVTSRPDPPPIRSSRAVTAKNLDGTGHL